MKLNMPPTKSSSLTISNQLEFAREGYDLLDQKRQILVLELMQYVDTAEHDQDSVDEVLARAHNALAEAATRVGSQALGRDALAVPVSQSVNVSVRRVMGIPVPETRADKVTFEPSYAFGGGTVKSDEAMAAFSQALDAIARLAETQNAVFRLARELRKTQRRANALDKVFIPDYEETLDFITATLEERERESFVIMRIIRDRLRKKPVPDAPTGGDQE